MWYRHIDPEGASFERSYFPEGKPSPVAPAVSPADLYEKVLATTVTYVEHARRMSIDEGDVRCAATFLFNYEFPSPLRHCVTDKVDFLRFTRRRVQTSFLSDLTIRDEALSLLHFLYINLNSFTVAEQVVDGGKNIVFESPHGVHARFFEAEWSVASEDADHPPDDDNKEWSKVVETMDN
jgi:hypothetical protein